MLSFVKNFVREEEGATMVEYGLMVALIAVACIAVVTTLGGSLQALFTDTSAGIDARPTP